MALQASQMPTHGNRLLVNIEKSDDATSLDLRLANLKKMDTYLEIRDMAGKTWFSQNIWRQHGYAKKLNLKGMPDGTYTLTVNHAEATVIQPLRLSKGVLEVLTHHKIEVPALQRNDLVKS